MTDCHYHEDTEATHQLDRGHRGEPVPLCQVCVDQLGDVNPAEAASLIHKLRT